MPYQATVLSIMLASPIDVLAERQSAREIVYEWNYAHSFGSRIVLMPVGWETHAAPELGSPAQELINERVLAGCDLLVGIFWTRLGTPTSVSVSGTVEEIEHHLAAGKPAMVYFSSRPISPESIDHKQYSALKEFQAWCEAHGLVDTFDSVDQFKSKFARQLQIQLNKNPHLSGIVEAARDDLNREVGLRLGQLSDAAKELLIEASKDDHGTIFKIENMAGRYLQTNSKDLFRSDNPRDFARAQHALNDLIDNGLIVDRRNGVVFELTESGFQLSDRLGDRS
jgi:hypothetical protein